MSIGALAELIRSEIDRQIIVRNPDPLPGTFDPATTVLDDAALVLCGLPPRPREPTARAFWAEMLRGVTTVAHAPPVRSLRGFRLGAFRSAARDPDDPAADPAMLDALPRGRLGSSRNWSGAAHLARRGERFTQVMAAWTVPTIAAGRGEEPFVCSVWIGVDGLRRWMDSMPQMGTAHVQGETSNIAHTDKDFVWWQWWLRGRGIQAPVEIAVTGFGKNRPIRCCMTLLPPGPATMGEPDCVQFFVRADASKTAHVVVVRPPADNRGRPVPARGASAEWIVERPTALEKSPNEKVRKGQLYPLPDFGTCAATHFAALLAKAPGAPPGGGGTGDDAQSTLRAPRRLRMVDRRDTTRPGIAVIAAPVVARRDCIAVRYKP